MSHRHYYTLSSYSLKNLTFRCKCGDEQEREPTAAERTILETSNSSAWGRSREVHKVWFEFIEEYATETKGHPLKWDGDRILDDIWDDKLEKKYPGFVKVAHVDNDLHENSAIVLIEHKSDVFYMGTTALYVPQHGEPVAFFLYPQDNEGLSAALKTIRKEARPIERAERRDKRQNPLSKLIKFKASK